MKKYEIEYPFSEFEKNFLFTGINKTEPTLFDEFRAELKTTDELLMIVAFVKGAISELYDDLENFTNRGGKINLITTTYTKASDFKAIDKLSRLKNTKIKINYDLEEIRLHAKAYYFKRNTGINSMYVGSSNLSYPALHRGLEWNVKLTSKTSKNLTDKFLEIFDQYFNDPIFEEYDPNDEQCVEKLKKHLEKNYFFKDNNIKKVMGLRKYQEEILLELQIKRKADNNRNLVVMPTGTGKTVVASYDFKRFLKENKNANLLFVSHRKEILKKSLETFRNVLNDNEFGEILDGTNKPKNYKNIFLSVQSTDKIKDKLTDFNYIIIDEVHHVASESYQQIIKQNPKILLGLTATPIRKDGANILKYFNNEVSYQMNLDYALNNRLISPFIYFGLHDEIDLSSVSFKYGKYDEKELSNKLIDKKRTKTIINAIERYVLNDIKALAFCSSLEHAKFMNKEFIKNNYKSMVVSSETLDKEREEAIQKLTNGEIEIICVVDLYNEGIDIPLVNTILFLRPTESPTVYIQQLGRGLRKHPDKEALIVLDFIGNANKKFSFLEKFKNVGIYYDNKTKKFKAPIGCDIILEEKATQEIIKNINENTKVMKNYYKECFNENENILMKDYFENYHVDIDTFYKNITFTDIKNNKESDLNIKKLFFNIINTNDINLLKKFNLFIKNIKKIDKFKPDNILEINEFLLCLNLLPYSNNFIGKKTKKNKELKEWIEKIVVYKKEITDLIDYIIKYKIKDLIEIEKNILKDVPFVIGGKYNSRQIAAVLNGNLQTGILEYNENIILKVTANGYYENQLIDSRNLIWSLQKTVKKTNKNNEKVWDNKKKKFIFYRESNKNGEFTELFTFLGEASVDYNDSKIDDEKYKLKLNNNYYKQQLN